MITLDDFSETAGLVFNVKMISLINVEVSFMGHF